MKAPADYSIKLPKQYHSKLLYGNYWIFDSVENNTLIWGKTRYFAVKSFLEFQKKNERKK